MNPIFYEFIKQCQDKKEIETISKDLFNSLTPLWAKDDNHIDFATYQSLLQLANTFVFKSYCKIRRITFFENFHVQSWLLLEDHGLLNPVTFSYIEQITEEKIESACAQLNTEYGIKLVAFFCQMPQLYRHLHYINDIKGELQNFYNTLMFLKNTPECAQLLTEQCIERTLMYLINGNSNYHSSYLSIGYLLCVFEKELLLGQECHLNELRPFIYEILICKHFPLLILDLLVLHYYQISNLVTHMQTIKILYDNNQIDGVTSYIESLMTISKKLFNAKDKATQQRDYLKTYLETESTILSSTRICQETSAKPIPTDDNPTNYVDVTIATLAWGLFGAPFATAMPAITATREYLSGKKATSLEPTTISCGLNIVQVEDVTKTLIDLFDHPVEDELMKNMSV